MFKEAALKMRQVGPCLAAEVEGIDLTKPLSPEDAAAIHAGMDEYAVLVFHDQPLDDEQQLAFTRCLGEIEHAIGTSLRAPDEYRLPTTFADVSNLDKNNNVYARDDRRRLFAIGNRLWHSDSSFKVVPAKYSLLHARSIPSKGGNTEFADMRAAYDALDAETQAEIEDMVCEHSQLYSRLQLGFTDFTDEERERFKPVRQRLVRTHPSTGRKSLYLASHAGAIVGWPRPEAMALQHLPRLKSIEENVANLPFEKFCRDQGVFGDTAEVIDRMQAPVTTSGSRRSSAGSIRATCCRARRSRGRCATSQRK